MYNFECLYPLEWDKEEMVNADALVLVGGIAECMAAIGAARSGQNVVLVEKGTAKRSGSGDSGCDHWESVATNHAQGLLRKNLPEPCLMLMMDIIMAEEGGRLISKLNSYCLI